MTRWLRSHRVEAALLAAGFLLRVLWLNAKSLWLDESMSLCIARSPLREIPSLVRGNELLPPLHYLLMHAWTAAFADPLLGLRVFSLLCGLAALAVFRLSCRRIIPRQATAALALACLSSYWIDVSQSGRPYALYLLLSALSFDLLLRLKDRWQTGPGLLYAAVGALGLYTHYYFAFALLSHIVFLVDRHRRRPRALKPWLAAYGFCLAAFLPWLPSVSTQLRLYAGKPTLTEPFGATQLCALFGGLFFNTSLAGLLLPGWTQAAGAAALLLFAAAPWFARRLDRGEKEALRLGLLLLIAPLTAMKLIELLLGRPMTQARYLVFLSVPAYILAALLIERLGRLARLAAGAILGAALAGGLIGYYASTLSLDSRLGALSAALRREARPGDVVVHLNPYYYTSLRYYYLPELPHFLLDARSPMLNWSALPGGKAVMPPRLLPRIKRCLVVDPERRIFERRVGIAAGAQIAAATQGPE